ncbi:MULTISPECIES: IS1595 family transposase [Paraburkholderia]|jgi:transposase-like protein|uniref:IS1595 family transposase n=1 Tax=Paraburkholderia hospita TaxID=169430 RepID=A0AAN1J5K6_9BURK|nr:IS1595 family transposase [Paraburkholderia hospita]AUT67880.1 IS1595 family transposase [Paraburkholderia hospita]SEH90100.1 Transposase zinc-ribbon domain-containing protein [Paraburkholderia hospita]
MSEAQHTPVAGQDYPQTWSQFEDWFSSEYDCLRYLERLRWREGFVCPRCGCRDEPYRANRARLVCRACRLQCTVTSGTIFDKTRTPLKVWLAAAWYITSQKSGVSALGLQRVLGLGSYQTAWTMLHRFRRAMVRPGREQLKGLVEVDQSYLAIRENRETPSGKPSKKRTTKALIVIAVEILEPRGFGRIRLKRIDRERVADVLPFVKSVVAPGSVIRTDGSPMYFSLEHHYAHDRVVVTSIADGERPPAHVPLPGVHRVASLLKRWLLGTHQGAVKPDQLDHYLDEFVFRFNRRTSRSRGLLFYRLLEQALATAPITYDNVVVNKSRRKDHQPPRCEIVELDG